jgi:serine/threonine-protein kinase
MADEPPDRSHLDPASRRVGTVLDGKWTLDRLLGVGGMAAVYAGTHRNGARAAIKLFPFSVTTSPESAERILREGYLANKIGHPAVVRVLDDHLDREREYAYLVMELLEGETARQRVERTGPLSPLEAAGYMIDLASALAAAHAKGVVHRDIKPENLFLTHAGELKVLDFGVARALDGTSTSVTRTGATLGTPAYMSPEQARGRPSEISPRSDLYSTGATLLFLITGEFMHPGESAQEVMVRAAWTPAEKIADRGLGVPEAIATIIDRACAFEPDDRYQSALELKDALQEASRLLAGDPAASQPVLRPSNYPGSAPSPTAPLPLSRPTGSAEATVADEGETPDEGETKTLPNQRSRRATWWVGSGLTAAVAALLVALWPRHSDHSSGRIAPPDLQAANQPAPTDKASLGGAAVAVPSPPAASAAAPPPAPETPQPSAPPPGEPARPGSPSPTAPTRKARTPAGPTTPPSRLSPPGGTTPSSPVAPPRAGDPPGAGRAPTAGGTKRLGSGRDVGY